MLKLEAILKISVLGKFKFKSSHVFFFLALVLIVFGVIVLAKPSSDSGGSFLNKDIPTEIFKTKDFPAFEAYTKQNGAKKAYEVLKTYFKNNEPDAHDFAHVIGNVAAQDNDIDGIKICDNYYNYGCYHGFMQIYLKNHGTAAVSDMEKSCLSLGEVNAPSCLHGIGHGLMMESFYDLGGALKNCGILKRDTQTYCFDGVFMERIIGSMLPGDKKLKIDQTSLLEPCRSVDSVYKKMCWRNQVSVWYSYFAKDTAKVASYCASLLQDYWQICFESIGLLNVQQIGNDSQKLVGACKIVDDVAYNDCLAGEVKELLFEGKSPDVARDLCSFATGSFRESCLSVFEQMFRDFQARFGQSN